jgi:hypothetical protein
MAESSPENQETMNQDAIRAFARLETGLRTCACATLASAIIAAAGRPVSVQEALDLQRDVYNANYGGELSSHGSYEAWVKTKDQRLNTTFN